VVNPIQYTLSDERGNHYQAEFYSSDWDVRPDGSLEPIVTLIINTNIYEYFKSNPKSVFEITPEYETTFGPVSKMEAINPSGSSTGPTRIRARPISPKSDAV
jgi:hypothetical protein